MRVKQSEKTPEEEEEIDELIKTLQRLDEPEFIYCGFEERRVKGGNYIANTLYVIYKIFKMIYCCIWFYFAPFATICLSYLLPYYKLLQNKAETVTD